jgi:hypothetical protein
MNILIAHWQDILAIWGALVLIASIVVKITPSQHDNEILDSVVKFVSKWLNWVSVVNPNK